MKNTIVLAALALLLLSCNKSKHSCIEQMLTDYDMKSYNGTKYTTGCNNYLSLYDWNGDQYFRLDNPCIDPISPTILDCDGNNICGDGSKCSDFFK